MMKTWKLSLTYVCECGERQICFSCGDASNCTAETWINRQCGWGFITYSTDSIAEHCYPYYYTRLMQMCLHDWTHGLLLSDPRVSAQRGYCVVGRGVHYI